jgi:hydrogenase maturation protease
MTDAIRIIGVGSPFGDDRAGWEAIAEVRARGVVGTLASTIEIRVLDRPGLQLVGELAAEKKLILIDAVCSGADIGTIHSISVESPVTLRPVLSSHNGGVMTALELARVLGEFPPRFLMLGIEADPANDGDSVTPAVRAALPEVARRIEECVKGWSAR